MTEMGAVQVAVHEVVHVPRMRDRLMTAAGAVDMAFLMSIDGGSQGADSRVETAGLQLVLAHVVAVEVVQVAIVQVVGVAAVGNGQMAAPRPVLVAVSLMDLAPLLYRHGNYSLGEKAGCRSRSRGP
jgi:hypothetical protein